MNRIIDFQPKMKIKCQDCEETFGSRRALVTHRAHESCESKVSKIKAKKDIQDTTIKFTKDVQEYRKLLSSEMDSLPNNGGNPHLLQSVPSLKTLSKRTYNETDDMFGTEISLFEDDTTANSLSSASKSHDDSHFKTMKFGIPDSLKAQIHLLNILGQHPSNLKLHDSIMKWLEYHGNNGEINFKEAKWLNRATVMKRLKSVLSVYGLEPRDKEVLLKSTPTLVTVPTFDFKAMLLSLIHDRELMRESNFIPDFDIFSGEETKLGPHVCGDIHTGDLYKSAKDIYCKNKEKDFPLPLIIFYDKTHTDLHGSLSTAPVMFTLGFFNQSARNSVDFWRVLGLVPNLSYGKGKNHDAPSREKLQDQHNCLKVILESISTIWKEGGLPTTILGKEVIIQPWIHVVIGDASGNNELCGHFNVHGNCMRPYRDCKCCFDMLDDPDPQCEYVTCKEVEDAFKNCRTGSISEISRHYVENAFDPANIPMADPIHGINSCTPPEGLHTFGSGIYTRVLETTHDIIGLDKTNGSVKDAIDTLHQTVVLNSRRQSERDFPRPSNRNGIMDGTKMGGTERRGNLFALVIALMTKKGKGLFDEHSKKHGLSKRKMIRTVMLLLSCEKWCHDNNLRDEVDSADNAFVGLKDMLLKNFPRRKILGDGRGNAWKLPKFHALSKFLRYMKLYGSAKNFNGGPGETNHIKFVKKPAQNTQRRPSSFTSQVATRTFETTMIETAYATIRDDVGDFDLESDDEEDEITTEGRYSIHFDAPTNLRKPYDRNFSVTWDDSNKNKLCHHVNKEMMGTISRNMADAGYKGQFKIRGFTCAKIKHDDGKLLLRCSPTYRGYQWYDFCMINYNLNNQSPAKIIGFFQYDTAGIPTPDLVDSGMTFDEIRQGKTRDYAIYAVVRSAKKYLSYEEIEKKFAVEFELGVGEEYMYILNVDSILGPLFAVSNFGGKNNEFITASPYRSWGKYFSNYIKECK